MKLRFLRAVGIVVAVGGTAAGRAAQVPTGPEFEVASVKPSTSAGRGTTMGTQPGRYTATNVTLRTLILNAYRLESVQLSGGPGWMSSDRFDIVAKIPAGEPDVQLMLRALLADRFKLVVHNESRAMPIYTLVTARSDRKLGPQIHPSTIDCAALAGPSTLKEKAGKEKSGVKTPCATTLAPGRMTARAATMATLAGSLSGSVQRTVLDRTGITGTFEIELTWTPDQMPQGSAGDALRVKGGSVKGAKIDPNGPSIFTALQEQLGLRLQSAKGPVDVLVIDRVERPSEN